RKWNIWSPHGTSKSRSETPSRIEMFCEVSCEERFRRIALVANVYAGRSRNWDVLARLVPARESVGICSLGRFRHFLPRTAADGGCRWKSCRRFNPRCECRSGGFCQRGSSPSHARVESATGGGGGGKRPGRNGSRSEGYAGPSRVFRPEGCSCPRTSKNFLHR